MHCALCVFGANALVCYFRSFGVANVYRNAKCYDVLNSLFVQYNMYIFVLNKLFEECSISFRKFEAHQNRRANRIQQTTAFDTYRTRNVETRPNSAETLDIFIHICIWCMCRRCVYKTRGVTQQRHIFFGTQLTAMHLKIGDQRQFRRLH